MSLKPSRRAVLLALASLALVAGTTLTADAQKKGGILARRQSGRAAGARRPLDDREHHRDADQPHLRRALQPRRATTGRSRCWPRATP